MALLKEKDSDVITNKKIVNVSLGSFDMNTRIFLNSKWDIHQTSVFSSHWILQKNKIKARITRYH